MLNSAGEWRDPCLVCDLREKDFNLSPLSMTLAVVLLYMVFIMLRFIPFTPRLLRVSIRKRGCIFSYALSASIQIITWLLSFVLLMGPITCIDLHMLNYPCLPRMNPTWSQCMILLTCFWIWFSNVLLRFFCTYVLHGYWSIFFFSRSVLIRL